MAMPNTWPRFLPDHSLGPPDVGVKPEIDVHTDGAGVPAGLETSQTLATGPAGLYVVVLPLAFVTTTQPSVLGGKGATVAAFNPVDAAQPMTTAAAAAAFVQLPIMFAPNARVRASPRK